MKNLYKIKVGIEEFPIEEKDIPRIIEAMKSNNMVQLEYGLFRGNAILAVTRDLEKEKEIAMISSRSEPTQEEKLENERVSKIKLQILNCSICKGTGQLVVDRKHASGSPDPFVKNCECTILKSEPVEMPKGSSPE